MSYLTQTQTRKGAERELRAPGDFGLRTEMSRLEFLKRLLAGAALAPATVVLGSGFDGLRGERVGWARLKTPNPHWRRHAEADPALTQFFRDSTTLNIDPTWYVASAEDLPEMCKYPLLFTQEVTTVRSATGRANLVEYIRRGGFLLIDDCCNRGITPDFGVWFQEHKAFLAGWLPEAQVVALPRDHDLYRCHFRIPNGQPPHTFDENIYDPEKARYGLYGIMIGRRMAGLISLSGLQCGWSHQAAPPGHDVACMKMLVNIYIYAMLQGN